MNYAERNQAGLQAVKVLLIHLLEFRIDCRNSLYSTSSSGHSKLDAIYDKTHELLKMAEEYTENKDA
ncbi:MAG: hypothetical protein EOM67_08530 [Spirochaetia bacterium]|nr:hypothetical protein [Spirochaetia bacterium]